MGWERHMHPVRHKKMNRQAISGTSGNQQKFNAHNLQSWLPEVYAGHPNRIEKYMQYDSMDMDSEVNIAVDTIAEFSTQLDDVTQLPFVLNWYDDPQESESTVVSEMLQQWCIVNKWKSRM